MWTDPIVHEVRNYRREIEKSYGGDFDKIFSRIKQREKKSKARLITEPIKREQEKKTA